MSKMILAHSGSLKSNHGRRYIGRKKGGVTGGKNVGISISQLTHTNITIPTTPPKNTFNRSQTIRGKVFSSEDMLDQKRSELLRTSDLVISVIEAKQSEPETSRNSYQRCSDVRRIIDAYSLGIEAIIRLHLICEEKRWRARDNEEKFARMRTVKVLSSQERPSHVFADGICGIKNENTECMSGVFVAIRAGSQKDVLSLFTPSLYSLAKDATTKCSCSVS